MVVGNLQARHVDRRAGSIGEHPPRRGMGEARLADALGTGEKPGVVKLARRPGAREIGDRLVLADDHGSRSAMESSNRAVTWSGLPVASTSFTRSGSSAAMIRNAASTLR